MIQSWGNDGRLANRRLETSATSVRLSSLTYGYDNNDNFTSIADTLDASKSRTYAYDAMDRLTRITGAPAPFAREDYVYDKNGNRLAVERRTTATTVPATQTDTYTIAANTNRLTSLATTAGTYSYTHDGRGNQSVEQWPDGSVIMVAYDGFARLTRYKVGLATQDMRYNGADERISVVTTPAVGVADTRIYIYDLDHRIVGEYGSAGVTDVKAEYIWTLPEVGASGPTGGDDGAGGYMPLAIVTGTTPAINWVHSHHNAKPILLTNAAGTVVAYTGHAVLGFPGQFANAVGLAGAQYYYNRYRDYNDVTGRYIQADPIGLAGDANPYAYAMGNTLRYSDPNGLNPVTLGRGAVVTGEILGGGLTIWCRSNIALCMRTIGPLAIRVAQTTNSLLDMAKAGPDCPNWLGPIISQNKSRRPPADAKDPSGPKAPGKPGTAEGFEDPRNGEAWGRAPNGGFGWVDKDGNVWVPTRGRGAHGGDHWDIQPGRGGPRPIGAGNVYPGGRRR